MLRYRILVDRDELQAPPTFECFSPPPHRGTRHETSSPVHCLQQHSPLLCSVVHSLHMYTSYPPLLLRRWINDSVLTLRCPVAPFYVGSTERPDHLLVPEYCHCDQHSQLLIRVLIISNVNGEHTREIDPLPRLADRPALCGDHGLHLADVLLGHPALLPAGDHSPKSTPT